MCLYVEFATITDVSHLISYARNQHCMVTNMELNRSKDLSLGSTVSAIMTLQFEEPISHAHIVELYGAIEGVTFIEEL